MIDHTNLKATTTKEEILPFNQRSERVSFCICMCNPTWVELASKELRVLT